MVRSHRQCIFCSGATALSREHIWPEWLEPHISRTMSSHSFSSSIVYPTHSDTVHRREIPGDPHNTVLKFVCEKCNNEWMSRIQNNAKGILLPMLQGNSANIKRKDKVTIATWNTMTLMVAAFLSKNKSSISEMERHWFYINQRPPANWNIWAGNFNRVEWVGYWAHNVFEFADKENGSERNLNNITPNTQTTSYVVGQLYLYAVSSTVPEVLKHFKGFVQTNYTRFNEVLIPIWPANNGVIRWPPVTTMTDRDADDIAAVFGRWCDYMQGSNP
jgi:hypothetical protein